MSTLPVFKIVITQHMCSILQNMFVETHCDMFTTLLP